MAETKNKDTEPGAASKAKAESVKELAPEADTDAVAHKAEEAALNLAGVNTPHVEAQEPEGSPKATKSAEEKASKEAAKAGASAAPIGDQAEAGDPVSLARIRGTKVDGAS